MEVSCRSGADVLIFVLLGNIRSNEDYDSFKEAVDSCILKKRYKVLLNFQDVDYINSAGLGRLILFAKILGEHSGELKISNLSKELKELFSFTRLDTRIQICDSEEKALAGFRK